jgi:hypothetical protein
MLGRVRHRDCSVASCAIFVNLDIFFSFDRLIIDLCEGRKYILFIHNSDNFCVISSAFVRLFGIAIAIECFESLFQFCGICFSVFVISHMTALESILLIFA